MKNSVLLSFVLFCLSVGAQGMPIDEQGSPFHARLHLPSSRKASSLGLGLIPLRLKPLVGWTGNGPYGGFASHFLFDAQNPGVQYAGTQFAGVFKSTDFGERWFPIGLENTYRTEGLVSPRTAPNVIYQNSEFIFNDPSYHSMVFKSTDCGATWSPCNNGLYGFYYSLAIHPTSPDSVYAGGSFGSLWDKTVMRTTDGGASWLFKGFAPDTGGYVTSLLVTEDSDRTVYAGVGFMMDVRFIGGVWVSTDAGETWEPRNNGFPQGASHYFVLSQGGFGDNPFNPYELYCSVAAAYDTSSHLFWGIYKTTDAGRAWVSVKPQWWTSYTDADHPTVDRRDTNIVYFASRDSGIVRSTDQGVTWRIVSGAGLPGNGRTAGMRCLHQEPWAGQRLWAANCRFNSGDGVFVSSDFGETWVQKNQGFTAAEVTAVTMDPQNPFVLYASSDIGGAFKSTDAGGSWFEINDSLLIPYPGNPWITREDLLSLTVARRSPGVLYAGSDGHGVFKSTNSGRSWFPSSQGMPSSYLPVCALVIDPRSDSLIYAGLSSWPHFGWIGGWGVYKSADAGFSWVRKNSGLGRDTLVSSLALSRSAPDTLYVGTIEGVFKSTNGGDSWQPTGAMPDSVISVCVDPWDSQIIYAGTATYGFYRSADGGASWVQRNNGLPSLFVRTIVCDTLHPGRLAAGTSAGVFWSDDWGENWREVGSGLTSAWGLAFQYLPVDSVKIYAGTCSRGVLSNTMAVGVEEFSLPLESFPFTSFHINPNPMREGCEISLVLPLAGRANLAIYDPLGRMVRMCFDGKFKAGFHKMFWDGRDGAGRLLPSGVYFLRLEAGGAEGVSLTRKLVVLR